LGAFNRSDEKKEFAQSARVTIELRRGGLGIGKLTKDGGS
jgi:hypothetical protein